MSGHRHAASVLYGVNVDDREAVLAGLPAPDRRILREHLEELADLGFDPAQMRLATADVAPSAPVPARAPAAALTAAEQIRGASAAAVGAVLANEPAALVADLLAVEAWPWAGAVGAALPAASRVALRLLENRPAPAPLLQAVLLGLVADAIAAMPKGADGAAAAEVQHDADADADADRAPVSLLGRLGNRFGAWTR